MHNVNLLTNCLTVAQSRDIELDIGMGETLKICKPKRHETPDEVKIALNK